MSIHKTKEEVTMEPWGWEMHGCDHVFLGAKVKDAYSCGLWSVEVVVPQHIHHIFEGPRTNSSFLNAPKMKLMCIVSV